MNEFDADVNKMLAMRQLYDLSKFDGPNGTETAKKEALRVRICQQASAISGVWVGEAAEPTPELA